MSECSYDNDILSNDLSDELDLLPAYSPTPMNLREARNNDFDVAERFSKI